jgi:hypothetical protein
MTDYLGNGNYLNVQKSFFLNESKCRVQTFQAFEERSAFASSWNPCFKTYQHVLLVRTAIMLVINLFI